MAKKTTAIKPDDIRYIARIPRQLPEGTVLVHNSVMPNKEFGIGSQGFRAWTQASDDELLEVCGCDWAGVDLYGLPQLPGQSTQQVTVPAQQKRSKPRFGGVFLCRRPRRLALLALNGRCLTGFSRQSSDGRISDMKREIVAFTNTVLALAVAGILHRPNGADVGASDHDHTEPNEAISPTIAAHPKPELRPVAAPPLNNSAAFADPIAPDWQPQSYVWGPPLALLAS